MCMFGLIIDSPDKKMLLLLMLLLVLQLVIEEAAVLLLEAGVVNLVEGEGVLCVGCGRPRVGQGGRVEGPIVEEGQGRGAGGGGGRRGGGGVHNVGERLGRRVAGGGRRHRCRGVEGRGGGGGGQTVGLARPGHPGRDVAGRPGLVVVGQLLPSTAHLGARCVAVAATTATAAAAICHCCCCAQAAAILLLGLHPPILEPDLDLALGEAERCG